jgi:single-stranded DNA-specific DHH superfamily exonuclease
MKNKFLIGSEKDFHNFVSSISKNEKIGIVTHTDLDGIASAIFLQKILESKNLKIDFIEFLDYGSGALKGILKKDFDILFFSDCNVDMYLEDFEKLRENKKVFVIDHHPLNEDLKDLNNILKTPYEYCSSHCLFDLAKDYFDTNSWKWLVCASIIADYTWDKADENFELIKSIYPDVKKDSSIWNSEPGKIGKLIGGALIYFSSDYKKVYDLVLNKDFSKLEDANNFVQEEVSFWLEKAKEESEYFEKEKFRFYFMNPKYNVVSIIASIFSDTCFKGDVVIFVSDILSREGFVKVSAREQTGRVDLGKLLRKCVDGFENASAGGHPRASAGNFPKKYLEEFKRRLLKELG